MEIHDARPAGNGSVYVPFDERDGGESVVFFTRDISPETVYLALPYNSIFILADGLKAISAVDTDDSITVGHLLAGTKILVLHSRQYTKVVLTCISPL